MDNKKIAKLEEEIQAAKKYLKKYTPPVSKSESDVIAEAMRKVKVKSSYCFHNNDDALNNSSHSLNNSSHEVGVALGSISCSHENETDLGGIVNSKTNRILVERYADQDKVTTKHRFTTESSEQFRLHRTTPNGHKHD